MASSFLSLVAAPKTWTPLRSVEDRDALEKTQRSHGKETERARGEAVGERRAREEEQEPRTEEKRDVGEKERPR